MNHALKFSFFLFKAQVLLKPIIYWRDAKEKIFSYKCSIHRMWLWWLYNLATFQQSLQVLASKYKITSLDWAVPCSGRVIQLGKSPWAASQLLFGHNEFNFDVWLLLAAYWLQQVMREGWWVKVTTFFARKYAWWLLSLTEVSQYQTHLTSC